MLDNDDSISGDGGPNVGDLVLMSSGLVGEVIKIRTGGMLRDIILYDIKTKTQLWRITDLNFTFPVPVNVVPMFDETLSIRSEKHNKELRDQEALAKRLRGDYDGDESK